MNYILHLEALFYHIKQLKFDIYFLLLYDVELNFISIQPRDTYILNFEFLLYFIFLSSLFNEILYLLHKNFSNVLKVISFVSEIHYF